MGRFADAAGMRAALKDLLTIAPLERQVALNELLDLLHSGHLKTRSVKGVTTPIQRGYPSGLG
jgi:hypothetical protein